MDTVWDSESSCRELDFGYVDLSTWPWLIYHHLCALIAGTVAHLRRFLGAVNVISPDLDRFPMNQILWCHCTCYGIEVLQGTFGHCRVCLLTLVIAEDLPRLVKNVHQLLGTPRQLVYRQAEGKLLRWYDPTITE